MIILKHNLRRSFKGWFWLILVFPIVVNLFGSALINRVQNNFDKGQSYSRIAIYSESESDIIENLLPTEKFKKVYTVNSKNEVQELLENQDVSVGVIFNSTNLYKDINENKEELIEVMSNSNDGSKEYVTSLLNNGIMQVQSYGNSKAEYLKAYSQYENDKFKVINKNSDLVEVMSYIIIFGLFGMIFLFISSRCLMQMLKERELKIEGRILATKISKVEYYLGHILGCYTLLLLQSIILVIGFYVLNPSFNFSIRWMIALSFALSFVGISISLVILGISNSSTMYNTLLPILITPMCLLSGGFLPSEYMPQVIQNVSLIFPLTWINSAFKKILMNGSYMSIGLDIVAAISISIVLIILYLVLENKRTNRAHS